MVGRLGTFRAKRQSDNTRKEEWKKAGGGVIGDQTDGVVGSPDAEEWSPDDLVEEVRIIF